MSNQNIRDRVYKVIIEQTGKQENEIKAESKYIEDLGLDSLDLVELVMAFEEEFATEIPDGDAEKLTTVQETIDYITNKSSTSSGA